MNINARPTPNDLLRLQIMHNGEKAKGTFSGAEMQRRQDNLRRALEEMKFDVIAQATGLETDAFWTSVSPWRVMRMASMARMPRRRPDSMTLRTSA